MKNFYPVLLVLFTAVPAIAQPPVAAFSVSPVPVCTGHTLQITDQSTGNPTSWSYTVSNGAPPLMLTTQNPSLTANAPGIFTVTLIATNANGASQPVSQTVQVFPSPNAQINPPIKHTCIGGNPVTVSVTAPPNAPFTYSWSTSTASSSITVQPTVTTIYSVVITSTNGCSTTRTATVAVGPPTITINSAPYMMCPGTTATLTATSTDPPPFTFTWSTGFSPGNSIITNTPGVYNVTVTTAANCTASQTYTLLSSPSLSMNATANPTAICRGNNAMLSASGATAYAWNTGPTTQNINVNPTVTTVYSVTGSYGTCTGVATVTLMVSVLPTITAVSNPTAICEGDPATLTASGATTYTWLPSTVSASMTDTPSVTTTYTVRGSNPGCQVRASTVTVIVMAKPPISVSSTADSICAGESVALAASGALTYTWNPGGTATVVIANPTITTTYTVSGTAVNQCTSTTTFVQYVDACVSIGESLPGKVFSVYPNPSGGELNLDAASAQTVYVTDISGRLVRTVYADGLSTVKMRLTPGVYFIHSSSPGGPALKIVVTD